MSDDELAAAIERVRRRFFAQRDARVGPLREAQQALEAGTAVRWSATYDAAHKIAGLAGSIGLPQLSTCAQALEAALLEAQSSPGCDLSRVANALAQLIGAWDDAERAQAA